MGLGFGIIRNINQRRSKGVSVLKTLGGFIRIASLDETTKSSTAFLDCSGVACQLNCYVSKQTLNKHYLFQYVKNSILHIYIRISLLCF